MTSQQPFRSYVPSVPLLRYDGGSEVCERCGAPTVEKVLTKGKRNQPQVFIECQSCGLTRPAAYGTLEREVPEPQEQHTSTPQD